MELLLNDLAFHGQFSDLNSFKQAIRQLMLMRNSIKKFGKELHHHQGIMDAQITQNMKMSQAISSFTNEERRAFLSWISQSQPCWNDPCNHSEDDYFDCNGAVVTSTALGEAAWCTIEGIERKLVSLDPSDWQFSPIVVNWIFDDIHKTAEVVNHWNLAGIELAFANAPTQLSSWKNLAEIAIARCVNIIFAADAFTPLDGCPFVKGAADRLLFILEILDKFKTCFDEKGNRTSEGNELYQNFFTGLKGSGGRGAIFTDSSDTEKAAFKKNLTFKHPEDALQTLFCPWHGKVQTPQMRVHFTYPINVSSPLYVVYVGEKLTKV